VFVLQLLEPVIQYRTPLDQLPYCNNTNGGNTTLYYAPTLPSGYFQYPCLQEDEVRATFPPDELDALFMTTRASFSNVMSPGA
jgi:hypothetical protein